MPSKILSKLTPLVILLAGLALCTALLFYFIPKDSIQSDLTSFITSDSTLLTEQEQVRSNLPIRLKIPKINVDSLVEYVGLTPDGAMDVPKNREDVAWLDFGPRPGEDGTAVISGHYGQKNKKTSAFDNLYKLRKGDKIYIEDEKGENVSFIVSKTRRYDPKADATDVFGTNTGLSHLNLITCEGEWDENSEDYPQRLVVFTDRE